MQCALRSSVTGWTPSEWELRESEGGGKHWAVNYGTGTHHAERERHRNFGVIISVTWLSCIITSTYLARHYPVHRVGKSGDPRKKLISFICMYISWGRQSLHVKYTIIINLCMKLFNYLTIPGYTTFSTLSSSVHVIITMDNMLSCFNVSSRVRFLVITNTRIHARHYLDIYYEKINAVIDVWDIMWPTSEQVSFGLERES